MSSTCNIKCFFDTLLGPQNQKNTNGTGGVPLADAIAAWKRPFAGLSKAAGGCPSI